MFRSLKTKIAIMTLCVAIMAVAVVTIFAVFFIRGTEQRRTDQLLLMLCEAGEKNLDYYFNGVQQSVEKVASFTESDLDGLDTDALEAHVERVRDYFNLVASRTNGVLTYYYRIDPAVSDTVKGFWYTDLYGDGFTEHEVTDISLYDTADTSKLVWFTVPKQTGNPIWLPPYITDNLDKEVISYNVPIYWKGEFVGVVGIEIDVSTMAEQVDSIRLYNNGYAFLNDAEGNLFYHPFIDVAQLTEETAPPLPDGLLGSSTFLRYRFNGEEKQAAWLPLINGMRLNVTVPVAEAEGDWKKLIGIILLVAVGVVVASILFTMFYTRRITKPIEELTDAANKVSRGNYEFELHYDRDDEVGRLTSTFQLLADHVKEHISDLNEKIYVDALTKVKNKGAFATAMQKLQLGIEEDPAGTAFAISVFDCDNLKAINDRYGHEKGDIYLRTASRLICNTFVHSPVFRAGGDEFVVILQAEDYENREALTARFEKSGEQITRAAGNPWEEVHVSMGIALYDPGQDKKAMDVARRADQCMYENKRKRKQPGSV